MRPPQSGCAGFGGGPGSSRTHAGGCHLLKIGPALTVGQDKSKTYSSNPACVKTHVQMDPNSRESRLCRDFLIITTELLLMGGALFSSRFLGMETGSGGCSFKLTPPVHLSLRN